MNSSVMYLQIDSLDWQILWSIRQIQIAAVHRIASARTILSTRQIWAQSGVDKQFQAQN